MLARERGNFEITRAVVLSCDHDGLRARPERLGFGLVALREPCSVAKLTMTLTDLEFEFLKRLASEPWMSTDSFDHECVARLIELGLVETEPLQSGQIEYRITQAGLAAVGESS